MKKNVIVYKNQKVFSVGKGGIEDLKDFKKKYGINLTVDNFFTDLEWERLNYLRHIPNFFKTDKEFLEYSNFAKRIGLPEPNRSSKIRPLHEKYN